MKPLPSSLELPVEGSGCISGTNNTNFSKDHILVNYNWDETTDELSAELVIVEYPPHVRNLLTQTVTHEEIRIYSGARVESDSSVRLQYPGNNTLSPPFQLIIKSSKRPNIERAITWIRRLLDQAMNLPKFKEKVLIGLENASPSFDVRGKVLGPGGANLQYITNETGAIVTLRGRGSGFIEPTTGLESIEPLHLCVEHNSKYEVLQAGRQLAFNLIETVQQEWFTYQQQQPQHVAPPPAPSVPVSHHGGAICSSTSTAQLVNMPPPTTAVPPLLTTSVPPPLIHQPPPQPNPLQLAANLNQLVQGPPPHLQPNQLSQPPPVHQQNQLVQQAHQQSQLIQQAQQPQPGQLLHTNHTQQNPLVQQSQQTTQLVQQSHQLVQPSQVIHASQLVQASQQNQIVEQNQAGQQGGIINQQSLSLVQQGQPSALLQAQQALGQAMVVPGSGGGVQVLQTSGPGGHTGVQVLQAGQLSTALQPQQTLQEIPHVYSAAGGAGATAANVLTQQVLAPQASIIAQQPHIISQASYPLQYMQSAGGGSMALLYGATPGGNTAGRDGVMVVQYGGTTARSRIQPQIVQLVHPTTGQVMGAAPFLLQAPPSPLLLQQPAAPPGLLLQQQATGPAPSSVLLPQHQLQFAQHQPVQIVPQPPPQTLMTVNTSSGQQSVVTSSVGVAVSSPGIRPVQGQKRRFEHDSASMQSFNSSAVSVSEVSSPQHNKKGIGDTESQSPNKMSRDQIHQPQSSQTSNAKLMLAATQSDEGEQQQMTRVEIKPDHVKRGRTGHCETDIDINKEGKTIYSYGSGKILTTYQHQAMPCVQQAPSITHQVMPPQLQVASQQGMTQPQGVSMQQGVTVSQGVVQSQGLPGPPQFSAPPPHYPPQYYQQPPYQTYQPTWNHMHNPSNQ